ncbi:MAG: VCBS repeat-containing protein [Gammaproteobacteria bacterium]|nr:VCBS repeat-containing protein [Gammaproteobacteria bacterium]
MTDLNPMPGWFSNNSDWTWSVAWGDVDGDGNLDLAVGNQNGPNRVYLNRGSSLDSTATWSDNDSDSTRSVAWGDVDGDGDLDLAVGNKSASNKIYLNDAGSLQMTADWSSNDNDITLSVAWGDVNGDGNLDLAVGNEFGPNKIYLNDGESLQTSAAWSSNDNDQTWSIAWGDVNGDGNLDLAAGNADVSNKVYLNQGTTLQTSAGWSDSDNDTSFSVAWGDVDGDGNLDLAVSNNVTSKVYLNMGNTLELTATWSSVDGGGQSIAWGDVDGDGDLDLAVGNTTNPPNKVYLNEGSSLPTTATWSFGNTNWTRSVAWGDMDSDGDLDLAIGKWGVNLVYLNREDALQPAANWSSNDNDQTRSVAWGDVNGDGNLDLAVGNSGASNASNKVYLNNGDSLQSTAAWSDNNDNDSTRSVAWGDMDSDGDLDLAVGNFDTWNRVYLNVGGTLQTTAAWSSDENDETTSVAWGDVDGDGNLDLAVGNAGTPAQNRVYLNTGDTLQSTASWSSDENDATTSVAWGDVDGDGDLDLAVGNYQAPNKIYLNKGETLQPAAAWSSNDNDQTQSVAWGDVDGDGNLDLAAGNGNAQNKVYLNQGNALQPDAGWLSGDSDLTISVAWGDVDGDGDLDLAAGNGGDPNKIYLNEGNSLQTTAVWSDNAGSDEDSTFSVAWGDVDGDGDLDLAAGNVGWEVNFVYQNPWRPSGSPLNTPPYVTVPRPGVTDDAAFFSTPHVITQSNVPILYNVFDLEDDPVRIIPEFSPNGGGQWFPATPGTGGDGLTNLAASPAPTGTLHTFAWKAEADLIKSDNVVFRIRAQSNYNHSPILWPAVDGKSPTFRVEAPWFIKVVNEDGNPVVGAFIYANGQQITQTNGLTVTNQAGLFNPGPLQVDDSLVALAPQAEQPTNREAHAGWAYRTYLTNLTLDDNGEPQPFVINQTSGEQRLVVRQDTPLVLFNLLVSIEWDADEAYIDEISEAMESASNYLYDLTDGQMAFRKVTIYDNGEYWAEADLQISTKNIVRPHAYIGGITAADKSYVIRIGRFWDGNSGNQGRWNLPDGYRTIAHEFGHYGLHLYDEYFAFIYDQNGNLDKEVKTHCPKRKPVSKDQEVPGHEYLDPEQDAINASAMYYHYLTSELSARGVPGMWSDLCEQTRHWQKTGESAWETLARVYADTENPPRWRLTTPLDRGSVEAGPNALEDASLPAWPEVETPPDPGPSAPPKHLTVYGPQGSYWGAIVALYKQDARVIGQGFTNNNGRLNIFGAIEGDTIRAASFDGGLAGSATVGSGTNLNLTMNPVGGLSVQTSGGIPHLRIVAEPSLNPSQVDLFISLEGFGAGADPSVTITEPGSETGQTPHLSYSPTTGTWGGQINFSATKQGLGRVRAVGEVNGSLVRLQSTYRLQRALNNQDHEIYSNDGNLSLHLDSGSLPGNDAYLVVTPPGAIPGPLPPGKVLVGDVYDVTASGALVTLEKPSILKLHYDGELVAGSPALRTELSIYRWDPNSQTWQEISSTLNLDQEVRVAPVTILGMYALLGLPNIEPENQNTFLPIILKMAP